MRETPEGFERLPRVPLWAMVLPALTLVAGVLIGMLVARVGGSTPAPQAAASAPPAAAPSASPDGVDVRVPVECMQLAQEALTSLPSINDANDALHNLDFQRLSDYVAQVEAAEPRLRDLGQQCTAKANQVQLAPAPASS